MINNTPLNAIQRIFNGNNEKPLLFQKHVYRRACKSIFCATCIDTMSISCLLVPWILGSPGPWFNIKMSSYQYRKSHCGDKTILRPSYLHNGISYTDKTTSLYWIRPQDINRCVTDHAKSQVLAFLEDEFPLPIPFLCRQIWYKII